MHPDAFYALSLSEWRAVLDGRRYGDGHHKTHALLAQLLSMFAGFVLAKAGRSSGHPQPAQFLPWISSKASVGSAASADKDQQANDAASVRIALLSQRLGRDNVTHKD